MQLLKVNLLFLYFTLDDVDAVGQFGVGDLTPLAQSHSELIDEKC